MAERRENALALYEEAAELSGKIGDSLGAAHSVRHAGDIHRDAGRVEDANRCYVEALGIYRGHAAPPLLDLANAIRPFAILKGETGQVEVSRRLWLEARDLYAALGGGWDPDELGSFPDLKIVRDE